MSPSSLFLRVFIINLVTPICLGFEGTWTAVGVNGHLLFARYDHGGHFSPHTDGYTIVNFNKRSLYTLIIYLNDCDVGGKLMLLGMHVSLINGLLILSIVCFFLFQHNCRVLFT